MRKFAFILIIAILLSTYSFSFAEDLTIEGQASILIDYDTKEVLYEKNIDMQLYPASTTKIITAILAIELGNLDDIVIIDQEMVNLTKGSHIALEPGEELTLEQILYALLVQSANDAAYTIAKHISGSVEEFAKLMNEKAVEIGATNTNFVNPNGLHDDKHLTTAHDLALIAQYAMHNDTFRKFVNTTAYTIEPTNKKDEARYLKITNKLLFSNEKINVDGYSIPIKYEGASGVKTGYTGNAQNCLVSFAEKDGQRLISVVLKATGNNVYSDTHKLLNYGFSEFSNSPICYNNEFVGNIKIEKGIQTYVAGIINKDLFYPLSIDNTEKIEKKVLLREKLVAPINKGDILGTTEFYLDGKHIGESDIISTMDVGLDPMTKTSNKILSKWYLIVFSFFILFRITVMQKRKKRRTRRSSYKVPFGIK